MLTVPVNCPQRERSARTGPRPIRYPGDTPHRPDAPGPESPVAVPAQLRPVSGFLDSASSMRGLVNTK
eukprot:7377350-Prymnesium_polylepis.2